jgi:hypothetical protein
VIDEGLVFVPAVHLLSGRRLEMRTLSFRRWLIRDRRRTSLGHARHLGRGSRTAVIGRHQVRAQTTSIGVDRFQMRLPSLQFLLSVAENLSRFASIGKGLADVSWNHWSVVK